MKLLGAKPDAEVVGLETLPGKVNYFIGNDPKKWRTNIPTYKKVEYEGVYPGINLVFYGNQRQLEYDFVVSPGADPKNIKLAFEGADKIEMAGGDLLIATAAGSLRMRKPLVYQEVAGAKKEIAGEYVLLSPQSSELSTRSVGFQLASYDTSKPLIIDPMLVYSTYLGGSGRDGAAGKIAVDLSGSAYVTGATNSSNFPTTPGVYQPSYRGDTDIFITKLNIDGSGLVYSTYIGGGRNEIGSSIAADSAGNAYVVGSTASGDFPTVNAFQNTFGGVGNDVVFLKLNAQGSTLLYSTYLGGNQGAEGATVALDSSANAYVSGRTGSTNFPTTPGAFQTTFGGWADVFVTKIYPTQVGAASLIYSTYLGGSGIEVVESIAVDSFGNAYVRGLTTSTNFPTLNGFQAVFGGGEHDDFVTKINSEGSALLYSTYLGGSGSETQDGGGIAVDSSGNIYVAGCTSSPDFPTKNALQPVYGGGRDAYVVKINPSQGGDDSLVYSTFLGGSGDECGAQIAVDTIGNPHLTANTNSTDFPTTPGAFQASYGGGPYDTFVAKLSCSGSTLLYSTYLGGSNEDAASGIAVDIAGHIYVAGHTNSTNFPVTLGAFQTTFAGGDYDGFVAKIFSDNQSSDNCPPTANAGGTYMVAEGGTLNLNGSGSDPDGDPLTYAWDLDNNGIFETAGQNPTFSAAGHDGPSSQTVILRVCDNKGACANSNVTVNITNVAPTVGGISAPVAPVQVNTLITTSASFTDPGVLDTHTAVWSWGDGTSTPGVVSETNGSGSVTGSYSYVTPGVYTVTLTVTDDDGGSGQSVFQFVVVYDPNAGFVTGGGWINSPAGAYTADPSLTGKANFGFVSKYQKGANVPTGVTQFQFKVADLNFHSNSYDWLVVGGARAQYKGTGTINGSGSYNFILTAIDGQVAGGGGADKFRIKIWGSGVIYDNQMGALDDANPTTALGGGSIVIHTQ